MTTRVDNNGGISPRLNKQLLGRCPHRIFVCVCVCKVVQSLCEIVGFAIFCDSFCSPSFVHEKLPFMAFHSSIHHPQFLTHWLHFDFNNFHAPFQDPDKTSFMWMQRKVIFGHAKIQKHRSPCTSSEKFFLKYS